MRWNVFVATLVGLVVATEASALAASPGKDGGKTGGPSSGGGGSSSSGSGDTGNGISKEGRPDAGVTDEDSKTKPWELDLYGEYHRLWYQNDLGGDQSSSGDAANRNVLYYEIAASWIPTKDDKFTVRAGMYQRFLTDPSQSGVTFDDMVVSYTRFIALPKDFTLRISPRVDIGTSYDSVEHSSFRFGPRLSVGLEKVIGGLTIYGLGYGQYYNYACKEGGTGYNCSSGGGTPNPYGRLAATLELSYNFPFYKPLTVGASGYVSATWLYEPSSSTPISGSATGNGYPNGAPTSVDPLTSSQPISNSAGGEIYARYDFPRASGLDSNLTVAIADGDPTIGYQNLLHDGVSHFNLGYRHNLESYAILQFKY
jgi:hypothetical protein